MEPGIKGRGTWTARWSFRETQAFYTPKIPATKQQMGGVILITNAPLLMSCATSIASGRAASWTARYVTMTPTIPIR